MFSNVRNSRFDLRGYFQGAAAIGGWEDRRGLLLNFFTKGAENLLGEFL